PRPPRQHRPRLARDRSRHPVAQRRRRLLARSGGLDRALPLRLHAHLVAAHFAIVEMPLELRPVGLGEFSVEVGVDEARDPCAAECLFATHDFFSPLFGPGNSMTSAAFTMPSRTA